MPLPSERFGFVQPRDVIQVDDFDEATRIALWNFTMRVRELVEGQMDGRASFYKWLRNYWAEHLHQPLDQFNAETTWASIRFSLMGEEWINVLDVLETVSKTSKHMKGIKEGNVAQALNELFVENLVGYRFISGEIVSVADENEVEAVEQAMKGGGEGARAHLRRAIQMLGDRKNPQYAKVISESIHAVEATVREMTGESVLSKGLKVLESKGVEAHPAMVSAWDKIYGYTSDAKGIRHALIKDEDADEPLATYFLVACSAFINMLVKKSAA